MTPANIHLTNHILLHLWCLFCPSYRAYSSGISSTHSYPSDPRTLLSSLLDTPHPHKMGRRVMRLLIGPYF